MNTYVVSLRRIVELNPKTRKLEELASKSHRYHATTSRLKLALNYLDEAIKRSQMNDVPGYHALIKLSIITYWACFSKSKSKLLLKEIPIDDILKDKSDIYEIHKKVERLRDKIIAHQDKIAELEYAVDLEFTVCCKKIIGLSFPWLEAPGFGSSEIEKFRQLIIIVHDYIDKERQNHDNALMNKLREIYSDEDWYNLCQENGLLTEKQYATPMVNRLLSF